MQDNRGMAIIEITPREAQRRMDTPGVVLVDVREEHERELGMAEGARGIARDELERETEFHFHDRDAELMLICQSGGRSMLAAEVCSAGASNVYRPRRHQRWMAWPAMARPDPPAPPRDPSTPSVLAHLCCQIGMRGQAWPGAA